ncbi:MAG: MJ0042-type zinc finger domain-containing protein [Ignavibacteriales bacterium]
MSSFYQTFVSAKVIQDHRIMCPNCNKFFWVMGKKSGQQVRCSKCGKTFTVPKN